MTPAIKVYAPGITVTADAPTARAKNGGYAAVTIVILFAAIVTALVIDLAAPVIEDYDSASGRISSVQSYAAASAGMDEALYRLKNNKNMPQSLTVDLSTGSSIVTVTSESYGLRLTSNGSRNSYQRNFQADLELGTGVSFHYGIQSGLGGFAMANSSSVTGSVFSNGSVTGSGNEISGDAISSGPAGLIDGIWTGGSAYANAIANSTVGGNAYYQSISNTSVSGSSYPSSQDQPIEPLPISDSDIASWEQQAAAGGTALCSNGSYNIKSDIVIGPIEIPCDLAISQSAVVTIAGPVWVVGNISIANSPTIQMSPSLGSQSVPVIADNQTASTTSGIITVSNSASFIGSGSPGSFIFLISQNGSAENGGSTNAISVANSTSAMVAYAGHGLISIGQSVHLKEATAYKISLSNSANIIYDQGLANTLFSAGPGGGYNLMDWMEM